MPKHCLLIILFFCLVACGGDKPYDENADAKVVIAQSAAEAKRLNKPMLIVFGANWCPDCRALSDAIEHGKEADKIKQAFQIVKVDVGDFDKNTDIANAYGNPIAGGIPGAAILNADKKLLYVTQPGELSATMRNGESSVFTLLTKHIGKPSNSN